MKRPYLSNVNPSVLGNYHSMDQVSNATQLVSFPNDVSINSMSIQIPHIPNNISNLHTVLPTQNAVDKTQRSATPFNQASANLINFNPVFQLQVPVNYNSPSNSFIISNQMISSATPINNVNIQSIDQLPKFNNISTPNITNNASISNVFSSGTTPNLATPTTNGIAKEPQTDLHSTSVSSIGTNSSASYYNSNALAAGAALRNDSNHLFNNNYLYGSNIPTDAAIASAQIAPSHPQFENVTKLPKLIVPNENLPRTQSNLRENVPAAYEPLVEFDGNKPAYINKKSASNNNVIDLGASSYESSISNPNSDAHIQDTSRSYSLTLALLEGSKKESIEPLNYPNSSLSQPETISAKNKDTYDNNHSNSRQRRKHPNKRKNSNNSSDSGSNGECYNKMGQLIGKSGKILRNTKRAAQNRSAQKAFRIRRELYIKDLEDKASHFDAVMEENKRLANLVKELQDSLSERENSNSSVSTTSSTASAKHKLTISSITTPSDIPFDLSSSSDKPTSSSIVIKKESTA